jgi:hypothetical protein
MAKSFMTKKKSGLGKMSLRETRAKLRMRVGLFKFTSSFGIFVVRLEEENFGKPENYWRGF